MIYETDYCHQLTSSLFLLLYFSFCFFFISDETEILISDNDSAMCISEDVNTLLLSNFLFTSDNVIWTCIYFFCHDSTVGIKSTKINAIDILGKILLYITLHYIPIPILISWLVFFIVRSKIATSYIELSALKLCKKSLKIPKG